MIVDCGIYQAGHRSATVRDLDEAAAAARGAADTFCWVDLRDTDETERDAVARAFGLRRTAVEDAFAAHQRPKLVSYEGALLVVLRTLRWSPDEPFERTGEVSVLVGPWFVVTLGHGPGVDIERIRAGLEQRPGLLEHGPAVVLYAVCDHVVDQYDTVADDLESAVDDIEQSVFSSERGSQAEAIYRLKRHVVRFRRSSRPLAGRMLRLADGVVEGVPDTTTRFFRAITDRAMRLNEQVDGLDDLLTSILSAHLAQVGVQQNDDMRRISAWVAIAAVPTVLAGIYGMNFDNMPELHWTFGYPAVVALMAVVCGLLYRGFKRAGWL